MARDHFTASTVLTPTLEHEIRAWLRSLAPTATQREAIVVELLKHARADAMRKSDRIFCRLALRRLRERP